MEENKNEKIDIKKWLRNVGGLYLTTFKYMLKNIISIILVCVICFTIVQLATAGYLKCMYLLPQAISGKNYIAADNLVSYLKTPAVYLIVITYMIILGNLFVFQMGVFIYIFDESKNGRRVNILKMLEFGFHSIKKLINPKNWLIFLFVLLIFPFADLLNFTYFKMTIVIPGFIFDYIAAKNALYIPYIIATTLLAILALFCLFSFHYFLLEDNISYFKACKKSVKMFVKKVPTIALLALLVYLTVMLAAFLISLIIVLFMGIFRGKMYSLYAFFVYVYDYQSSIVLIVALPFIFAVISVLFYYSHSDEYNKYTIPEIRNNFKLVIIRNVILGIFLIGFSLTDIILNIPNYAVYNTESCFPNIIAHRGSSVETPENSIAAFDLAVEQGADMIELDIHQTKDGVLVITHDDNLKRIAGINKGVYEYTYEELKQLDVGSWFSSEYSYLRVATLEEVIIRYKDQVQLLIEVKPTAYDDHLEEKLVELINKYDIKDQVVVHSLKDAPLKKIKEIDSTIKIAYCMVVAIGDIQSIEWADEFTVEESYISPELVRKVHEAGKKIHVWTVNKTDSVQKLIDCGVDGIIGDDVLALKETVFSANYDAGFSKFLRMFALQELVM